jgi:hypothetical protein
MLLEADPLLPIDLFDQLLFLDAGRRFSYATIRFF